MMLQGILGLFIGPVVLALGYQIYSTWVAEGIEEIPVKKELKE